MTSSGESSGHLPPPPSDADRHEMAMNFVQAFMGGQLTIEKPTREQFEAYKPVFNANIQHTLPDYDPKKLTWTELSALFDEYFDRYGAIIMGTLPATEEQRRETVNAILNLIWSLRGGHRLKGEFLAIPNLKASVQSLESKVKRLEKLLEELGILIRALDGGRNLGTGQGTP